MKELLPLKQSAEFDNVEKELKELTIFLWQKMLYESAKDINLYGMPHLGSKNLLLKELVDLGISNFNTTKLTQEKARYLVLAKKHNNQKRGLHLLRTFIKCTWGDNFEVHQLWQKISEPYPTVLKTIDEIEQDGESANNYFLTSRLRVELNGVTDKFPDEVADTIQAVLASRLFVAEIIKKIIASSTIQIGSIANAYSITKGLSGKVTVLPIEHKDKYKFYSLSRSYSLTTGKG